MNNTKSILITGATGGLGKDMVFESLKKGWKVYACGRNKEKIELLVEQCDKMIGSIEPIIFDHENITKEKLDNLFGNIETLDYVINNAGKYLKKEFESINEKDLLSIYKINVFTPLYIIQSLKGKLAKSKEPQVINIGSAGGVTETTKFSGFSAYSSSKGAISILSECIAVDLAETNIYVNCFALGAVRTQMLMNAFPNYNGGVESKDAAKYIINYLSLPRLNNGKTFVLNLSSV